MFKVTLTFCSGTFTGELPSVRVARKAVRVMATDWLNCILTRAQMPDWGGVVCAGDATAAILHASARKS